MRGLGVKYAVSAAAWLVMVGCSGAGSEELGTSEDEISVLDEELSADNGGNLNGSNLNGGNLNGGNLNGGNLNGGNLNGRELNNTLVSVAYAGATTASGAPISSVTLRGTSFAGRRGSQILFGKDFEQARFVGKLGSGDSIAVKVESAQQGSGADDLWSYRITYQTRQGNWRSVCRTAQGAPLNAIPVANRWDYRHGLPGVGGAKIQDATAFTFACEGAAIAKCVRFGYRPWTSAGAASLHQACTRLIRADYCGDGSTHTVDGQWVNLYDAQGIQQDTESWRFEAEWDEAGSRCFTDNHRTSRRFTCGDARDNWPTCGARSHFQSGALLMSEVPANQR